MMVLVGITSKLLRRDLAQVAIVDICHAHLWNCAGATVTQVAAVVVDVAEPHWLPCDWMSVDGR
eukprot:49700-Amphidinium_carterae.1